MNKRIQIKQYVKNKRNNIKKVIPLFDKVISRVKWDSPVWRMHSDKYYHTKVSTSFIPKQMCDVFKGALDVVLKNGELYYYIYIDTLDCVDFTRYDEAMIESEGFVSKTNFDSLQEEILNIMMQNYSKSRVSIFENSQFEGMARQIIFRNVLELKTKYNIPTIGVRNDAPYGWTMSPSHTLCLYGVVDENVLDDFYQEYSANYWDKFENAGKEHMYAELSLSNGIEYEGYNMKKSERSQYQYII